MFKINTRVLFFFYLLAVMLFIIIVNMNHGFLGSQDIENHYTLANKIATDGSVSVGYQESVGIMKGYPPLSHWIAALLSKVTNSTLLSMNITILISFSLIYFIFAFFLLRVNIFAFFIFSSFFILSFSIAKNVPLIGTEIGGNFFYAQFVSQAYILLILGIVFSYKMSVEAKYLFSILALAFGFCIHPSIPLVGFGSLVITNFYDTSIEKSKARAFVYSGFFIFLTGLVFILIPFNRAMLSISSNNGHLGFWLFTSSPTDITRAGVVLIIVGTVYSAFSLWILFKDDCVHNLQSRSKLFVSAALLSASGLALLQYALSFWGIGNPYAVKKYFFFLFTFFLILVAIHLGTFIGKMVKNTVVTPFIGKKEVRYLLLPALAILAAVPVFSSFQFDVMEILQWQNEARHYYLYHSPDNAKHNMISQLPISPVLNYLITVGDLQFPRNSTAYKVLRDKTSLADPEDYYVMTDSSYPGDKAVYRGGRIAIMPKNAYYSNIHVLDYNRKIYFNSPLSKRFFKQGFSAIEPWGVWSDGMESILEFTIPQSQQRRNKIVMFVTPWIVPGHSAFSADIFLNGIKIDRWNFTKTGVEKKEITLPSNILFKGNTQIAFRYSNVVSPADLKMSSDIRKLSLGFLTLELVDTNRPVLADERESATSKLKPATSYHFLRTLIPKTSAGTLHVFKQEITSSASLQTLKTNETSTMQVRVKNIGNEVWPSKGINEKALNRVGLGFYWIDRSGKEILPGRVLLPYDLMPGSTSTLEVRIQAPSQPGNYTLRFSMVQEHVAWFHDRGATPLEINVKVKSK